jgi:hypothetical protein
MSRFFKVPQLNHVWRFYTGEDRKWRWQCLDVHHAVISESHTAYEDYERCVGDARKKGYVAQALPVAPARTTSRITTFRHRER